MLYRPSVVSVEEVHRHRGWFVFLGIVLLLLGLIAIGFDELATIVSVLVFGWLLLIGGVVEIIHAFGTRRWGGFFLHLLAGLLSGFVGVLFIWHPVAGALTLTLLLGTLFLIGGVFRIVAAASLRFPHWGWGVLGGVITGVLGALLWAQWPVSGLWFLGLAVGIDMIFRGWAWVALGLIAHRAPVPTGRAQTT